MKYLLCFTLIANTVFADDQRSISTDSLAVLIGSGNDTILDEVIYEDPTANKTIGVMFNPLATLLYQDGLKLIGGLSYFPKGSKTELSLNAAYMNDSDNDDYTLNIDILNRFYFDRKYRKGFHLLYGGRITSYLNTDFLFVEDLPKQSADMLGLSFGVGYRILNKNGWYWGTSMYAGRHLIINDKSDEVYNGEGVAETFFWMEFFKFGYIFK